MDVSDLIKALRRPFHESEIQWKPQVITKDKALAVAFVDARCVMDRLDEVVGPQNWYDHYQRVAKSSVYCMLSVRLNGEWITKADVGSTSDQPDAGDALKAAYSDALKRAAVKFGIGRYLYQAVPQWVRYDIGRKRFLDEPRLVLDRVVHSPMPDATGTGVGVQLPEKGSEPVGEMDLVAGFAERIRACRTKMELDVCIQKIVDAFRQTTVSDKSREFLKDLVRKQKEALNIHE